MSGFPCHPSPLTLFLPYCFHLGAYLAVSILGAHQLFSKINISPRPFAKKKGLHLTIHYFISSQSSQ